MHSRARADFEWFIRNGYVQAVLAGNAVAVHDIEAAIFGTTLGMSNTGQPTEGGHGLHMRAINRVRAAGSIERAVESGLIKSGIMHALVTHGVPVRAGRLDPRRRPAARRLQRHARRRRTRCASTRCKATGGDLRRHRAPRHRGRQHAAGVPHSATGLPAPLMTICVDQTEFVVNKLKDRGTHQAYGVVTNAQDFMHVLRFYTERWEQGGDRDRLPAGPGSPPRWRSSIPPARGGRRLGLQPTLRHEGREWGTAIARAGSMATAGGSTPPATCSRSRARSAGKFEASVEEVGSGPVEALAELLQRRPAPDRRRQPPMPVPPDEWLAAAADAQPR